MHELRNISDKKSLDNKKILVVRTDKIGDLILSLPFGKFIKMNFPNSKIFYVVKEGNSFFLQRVDFVDGFIEVKVKGARGEVELSQIPKIIKFLKKEKFDIAFLLYPRLSIALILKLAGVKIVGTSRRFFSTIFDIQVNISRRENIHHEAFYNIMLLKDFLDILDNQEILKELSPNFFTDDIKKLSSLPEKYIVFHPFSTSSPNIPLHSWIEIAKNLQTTVVWVGLESRFGKSSDQYKNQIEKSALGISLINRTSLTELVSAIKFSSAVFSTSSGPIHIASALKIPTIGLYRRQDIPRWKPLWGDSFIVDIEKIKWDNPSHIKDIADKIEKFTK